MEGRVYVWDAHGQRVTLEAEPARTRASRSSRSRTCARAREPHPARLHRLAGAGRPRRQRRRQARDRRRGDGPPRLRLERRRRAVPASRARGRPRQGRSIDPPTHAVDFDDRRPATRSTRARSSTRPAVGDIAGDGAAGDRRGDERGVRQGRRRAASTPGPLNTAASIAVLAPPACSSRQRAPVRDRGRAATRRQPDDGRALVAGWPVKVGLLHGRAAARGGRGHHGVAGDRRRRLPGGGAAPEVGAMPAAGPAYIFGADGSVVLRQGPTRPATSPWPPTRRPAPDADCPHPRLRPARLRRLGGRSRRSWRRPRADPRARRGRPRVPGRPGLRRRVGPGPGVPARTGRRAVNDLQFLTGPSVGDVDGAAGRGGVAGTASLDLRGSRPRAAGRRGVAQADRRLDVATPLLGTFGTRDTDPARAQGGRGDDTRRARARLRTGAGLHAAARGRASTTTTPTPATRGRAAAG